MGFERFKAMSFDVVGTLIDFERGMLDHLHRVAPGAKVDDQAFLDAYRAERKSPEVQPYPDDIARVWRVLAPRFGLPSGDDVAEGFRQSVAQWPAFSDSVAALAKLRQRYLLVAMTNTQRWAVGHFERTLGHPFTDVVTADDARCEKPDPQFFAYTRGRLSMRGITLEETLHVAQSQYHDIGIAKKLGYTTCWIERRAGQQGFGATIDVGAITKPDHHFTSMAQFVAAVFSV